MIDVPTTELSYIVKCHSACSIQVTPGFATYVFWHRFAWEYRAEAIAGSARAEILLASVTMI